MITSPSGANTFWVRGFKSKQSLNNHWRDHGKQYQGFTSAQYEQRALELIESPVGGINYYLTRKKEDIEHGGRE